ncbi:MAG: VWA domain-containing protein [Pseudomonadales bacterium]|nr:VWA domain-containing protein [Gammaproteobacteria bacterium]MBP6052555.1 VWA domain-containing protein [Pseudomonadales bacterium]MBK6582061.1 VWA domain-containing protein [Gammaproteobacteria bacterium]MBK7521666.1 VWA domain-containing protein [Gammaproteobacteria bacterium]MBK8307528.1 VWA domain-containing protein [Gammaproteobacteria bacterium]
MNYKVAGKLFGLALFSLTLAAIVYYPALDAAVIRQPPPRIEPVPHANRQPVVDVVFVLDTTGSMAGLIETAREKIWSIATTMAAAQPTPAIRIGLVGFRDRGDAYITKRVELSGDLDSVYAALMDFAADGGGDGPESVNAALDEAVRRMSWSQAGNAYKVIFLVGDAPPHMDYQDEAQYPEILVAAAQKGIVVNTIQCGDSVATVQPWTQIASLGHGAFLQVEQAGGAVAISTPYDAQIATLSARLDATRLYYGSTEDKAKMSAKIAATEKLHDGASVASRARRGAFNAAPAGKSNFLGDKELVSAVAEGSLKLEELEHDALPEALKPMAPAAQQAYIGELASERRQLEGEVRDLAAARSEFLRKKVEQAGGAKDSLDQKLYDTVSRQAAEAGLVYTDGPDY